MPRQLTLALIKPDVCAYRPSVTQILKDIRSDPHSFEIVQSKYVFWKRADAEAFYQEHKGKFFFERLCGYMTSGPFSALILSQDDAIKRWRALIGPTHPVRAKVNQPDTLRAKWGLTDTRNSFHGSDSNETASHEIQFFFPEFNVDDWRAKHS